MTATAAVTWISFVIALLAGGGLTLQRTKVRELRADVNDERGRTQAVREEFAEFKLKYADTEAAHQRDKTESATKVAQLQSDLRHAEQMATGEEKWSEIEDRIVLHDERALRQIAYVENQIRDVKGTVTNLAEEFHSLAQRWQP